MLLLYFCRKCEFLCISIPSVPPTASLPQSSVILPASNSWVFKQACKATGFPKPRVIWKKTEGPSYRTFSVGKLLKIRNPEKIDSGIYTCFASNAAGKANASIFVLVRGMYALSSHCVSIQSPSSFFNNQ